MSDEDAIMRTESVMNVRALVSLLGHLPASPKGVGVELINLLRSAHPISREVREALANAIERGLFGNRIEQRNSYGQLMPWMQIEGMGRDGRVGESINVRRRWLDAAEELNRRRASGERGYDVIDEVGSQFGLGIDGMKKANTLLKKFQKEISDLQSPIVKETLEFWADDTFDPNPSQDGPTGGDHYYYARSLFIEREAEIACK